MIVFRYNHLDMHGCLSPLRLPFTATPGWLSGEHVGLMTYWLWVQDPVDANFLSGVFSPLTSTEACEKGSWWLWKEICVSTGVSTGVRKPGNTYASPTAMIIMTLAVKVALNPITTNQPSLFILNSLHHWGQDMEFCKWHRSRSY